MANEWDIQDGESTEAYVAFTKYLTMPDRSGESLSKNSGLPLGTIKEWRRLYAWRNRARAYDMATSNRLMEIQQRLVENNQETIIMDSLNDYNLLIIKWHEAVDSQEQMTPNALTTLVSARKRIDDFGRRAVKLPNVYADSEIPAVTPPPRKQLTWNNPIEELQQSNDGDSSTEAE